MRRFVPLVILSALVGGCASQADSLAEVREDAPASGIVVMPSLATDQEAWVARREAGLQSETGYLALCGLHWVSPGEHTFGSSPDADLRFPSWTAASLGVVTRTGDALVVRPAAGVELLVDDVPLTSETTLASDTDEGGPTRVRAGSLTFWAIRRGERLGLRLRDAASPVLAAYHGTERFTVDPTWYVVARFVPFDEPRAVRVANILGDMGDDLAYGKLVFSHGDRIVELLPTGDPAVGLELMFGDATNGESTYGGGRFLSLETPDADGLVVLDFNRAYNPPCAYSPYTTCPLPLPENVLALAVTAGEKAYDESAHADRGTR